MTLHPSQESDGVELEAASDEMLVVLPPDLERPAYSERQLERRGWRTIHLDRIAQQTAAPPQPFRDELRFLMSVTRMDPELCRCVKLWADGWSQVEIAEAYRISQQRVSQRLRAGLRRCYDAMPLSFRVFSEHSIYRPPRHVRGRAILRRCVHCGDEYALGAGWGRYCSTLCRETARHEAKQ